jgi:glycerol-3-phosphate dehydrogenase
MAETITDTICSRLGKRRPCRTPEFRLECIPDEPWPRFRDNEIAKLRVNYRLEEGKARHLVGRYGKHAGKVADLIAKDASLDKPIVAREPDLQAELPYQRDEEMACFPADHLLRRTRVGLFHSELLGTIC